MASVTFQNVQKSYGKTQIIERLGFEIEDGEFVVLVGPSGCGKSTLLRMLAGLEDITGGEIMIDGRVVNELESKDRDIAMVFQSYALYPHMTVRDNMGFSLKLRKAPASMITERVSRAATILNLNPYLERYPRELSGGQRQRVAMGRAIVRDPAAFLMDEPLSNLDAKLRVQMRTEVSRIQKRLATTTVYVTHDQTEAMTLGDRVAVMRNGLLQQVGHPQDLYRNPTNLFVAGFIGSPAMNFMPGRLEEGVVRTKLGDLPLTDESRRALDGSGTGRDVIVGVRPENFEDAALVPPGDKAHGVTFSATVDVLESMGSDVFAYFKLEGGPAESAELEELARDSGRADTGGEGDQIVARLDAATQIKEGDQAELWVDVRPLHLFEPGTGANLTVRPEAASAAAAPS